MKLKIIQNLHSVRLILSRTVCTYVHVYEDRLEGQSIIRIESSLVGQLPFLILIDVVNPTILFQRVLPEGRLSSRQIVK